MTQSQELASYKNIIAYSKLFEVLDLVFISACFIFSPGSDTKAW